jgi:putative FmdB family regulatory protein
MPTYEYRCPNGHHFELFQKMSEEPVAPCPECGKDSERLLSAGAGLLFKGEGFYITDYRSDSYKKAASSEKEAPKKAKGDEKPKKDSGGTSAKSSSSSSSSSSE